MTRDAATKGYEAEQANRLINSSSWGWLVAEIEERRNDLLRQLAQPEKTERELRNLQGQIVSLDWIMELPENVIRAFDDEANEREGQNEEEDDRRIPTGL